MSDPSPSPHERTVQLQRTGRLAFRATNARGGVIEMGDGSTSDFSPVELLLAAIAGCTGMDVDAITSKRAEPDVFEVTMSAQKVRDGDGNHLVDITLDLIARFGDDPGGEAARSVLGGALRASHGRLCTVSRTVELASPVEVLLDGEPVGS
jgi:putative redox protein